MGRGSVGEGKLACAWGGINRGGGEKNKLVPNIGYVMYYVGFYREVNGG